MSLLSASAVSVSNGGKPVCTDMNFCLERGQIWGVLGPNGIGKTTMLHILAGLRKPDRGRLTLYDRPVDDYGRRFIAANVGILFQYSHDTFPATVLETVLMGRYPHLSIWAWESALDIRLCMDALRQVSLCGMADRQIGTLSGGERRRLAIATLLVQQPTVWLLDEPTNHLDMHHQMILLDLMVQGAVERNGAIVMVLQDVNLVPRFCTHVLMMGSADTRICGRVDEVLTTGNLEALFHHSIRMVVDNGVKLFYPA